MPETRHYDDDILDFCYVYTFDEAWKDGLLQTVEKAYETRRLFLKDKCKTFTLEKQLRDLDFDMMGEREVLDMIYKHFVDKYHITNDKKQNYIMLQDAGFILGENLSTQILQGVYAHIDSVTTNAQYITTYQQVDTHSHGIYLMHSVDELKKAIGLSAAKTKAILERLFRKSMNPNKKIVNLDTKEFYAFIINNVKKLRVEFVEVAASMQMSEQLHMMLSPKTTTFHIPEQDFFKYDPGVKNEVEYLTNAYKDYTSGFTTSMVRSQPEQMFEAYCEADKDVEWVYKNGDTGQQYFSIVYTNSFLKQWLFYPDYIVKKKDGSIWVIETKGGESHGSNHNIDAQIGNKFNAFKDYAAKHDLKWGFVRDRDGALYINNTEFVLEMSDEHWQPLDEVFGGQQNRQMSML